jgi:hypothetical protein
MTLSQEEKELLTKVSAISGYPKDLIKEVWEFTMIHWLETIVGKADEDDKLQVARLTIPYLGTLGVKYLGSYFDSTTGKVSAEVNVFSNLSEEFKESIEHLKSNKDYAPILEVLDKKIEKVVESLIEMS